MYVQRSKKMRDTAPAALYVRQTQNVCVKNSEKWKKENAIVDSLLKLNNLPPIVTLCGSTRFKEEFLEVNRTLTLAGAIVLMPGVFAHCGDTITDEQKEGLDILHKQKIAISDLIIIIDKYDYIGESTASEIGFAESLGIPTYYYRQMGGR